MHGKAMQGHGVVECLEDDPNGRRQHAFEKSTQTITTSSHREPKAIKLVIPDRHAGAKQRKKTRSLWERMSEAHMRGVGAQPP